MGGVSARGGLVRGWGDCQSSTHCLYKRKMSEPKVEAFLGKESKTLGKRIFSYILL